MEITLRQMLGKPSQNPAFLTTWLSSQDRQEADVLPASGNGAAGALMSPSTALRTTTPPPPLCRSGVFLPETGAAAPEQHHQLYHRSAASSGRQHGKLHEGSLVFHTPQHELVTFFWVFCR